MPYRITFVLADRTDPVLEVMLGCLTTLDVSYLRAHPETPGAAWALQSQVGLLTDGRPGDWQDIPTTLRQREGNLPTIGAWSHAEYAVKGGAKRPPLIPLSGPAFDDARRTGRIPFQLDLFNGQAEKALSFEALGIMLDSLVRIDEIQLRKFPSIPLLRDSSVRYREEPRGLEDWTDVLTTLQMGEGDCEELACWRVAELRVRYGVQARPIFKAQVRENGSYLFHIQVELPDGRIEDPSREKGMGSPQGQPLGTGTGGVVMAQRPALMFPRQAPMMRHRRR